MNWISVNDRLPKYGVDVLACVKIGKEHKVMVLWYGEKKYQGNDYWMRSKTQEHSAYKPVTHWQPLPKPPQVEMG